MQSTTLLNEIPGMNEFMERISYRARRIEEYSNHPTMTPLQKLKAILSVDEEFDWILHLRHTASKQASLISSTHNKAA